MVSIFHEKSFSFRVKRRDRAAMIEKISALAWEVSARVDMFGRIVVEYPYGEEEKVLKFINRELPTTTVLIRGQSLMTSADFS